MSSIRWVDLVIFEQVNVFGCLIANLVSGGMTAMGQTSSLSLQHGVRLLPDPAVVEEVLLAVGDQVGHDKLSHASRMNKVVVVFLSKTM